MSMDLMYCQEVIRKFWTDPTEMNTSEKNDLVDAVKQLVEFDDLELEDQEEMLSNRWSTLMIDEEEKQKEDLEKSKKEQGRKLFIGNLTAKDDAPLVFDTLFVFVVVALKFGPLERVRYNGPKRFCFLLYESMEDAVQAHEILRPFETRKDIIEQFAKAWDQPCTHLPKTNFYCRWPKDARHLEITSTGPKTETVSKTKRRRGRGKRTHPRRKPQPKSKEPTSVATDE